MQIETCTETAPRYDIEIVAVLIDKVSGYKDRGRQRPEWQRLLEMIRAGEAEGALVYKSERLSRGGGPGYAPFWDACEQMGLDLDHVVATPSGFESEFNMGIRATMDREESKKLASRMRDIKAKAAQRGRQHGGGQPRFGYHRPRPDGAPCPTCGTYDTDGLCVPAVAAIRNAASRVLRGESYGTVVADWAERGLVDGAGGPWTVRQVAALLRRPHLAGLRVHRGEVVGDATWPAILDRATHDALNALRRGPRTSARRSYLLTGGLAVCGREGCGKPLRGNTDREVRYYRCWGPPGGDGCGRLWITADPFEIYVTDAALGALERPEVRRALRAGADVADAGYRQAQADLGAAERKLDDLGAERAREELSPRAYQSAARVVEMEIATIERQMSRLAVKQKALDVPDDDVEGEWFRRDLTWRASMVRALFETPIVVSPAPVGWGKRSAVEGRVRLIPKV